ncbi:zinc finger protein 585A-like isoform X2 [Pararge aegeria]|uniref:zinc finger protein 585A-like isoform X2 n=1 Tax=Pararge aegeria TaxID=116150 RepID=UPI0019CF9EEC|nr:zinc finger protein 585A-like isoform X2 [Pararge aegeria]
MYPWNCCRTCLSTQSLHPIFINTGQSDKYTKVILTTTGVKVEINDTMPQEICISCISFINESIRFRRRCEEVQNTLLDNKCNGIKLEGTQLKLEEQHPSIDITDDDDFKDFDDNITLDTLQYHEVPVENHNNADSKIFIDSAENHCDSSNKGIVNSDDDQVNVSSNKNILNVIEDNLNGKFENKVGLVDKSMLFNKKRKTRVKTVRDKEKNDKTVDVKVKEHCGKKFITRRLLLMHCRAKHGYEKTDKCSFCDYRASNAEQVKIHERLHTGEKPFICKTCSAGFHRKSSYLQHVAIHLPEKTVQCDQCPARFKSVTLMRIHKNRHRPSQYTFKCGVCNNSFARRRNVARHLQRVHGLPPDHHIHRSKIH